MEQRIRFCTAPDGLRLAYAIHGSGPPIVKAANWLTHLQYDWESPVWRHWLEELGRAHTLVRYDERGCGLSDRNIGDLSIAGWVADLETVVEAAAETTELERFTLLGVSQGAAVAIAYAVRHPERVERLVIYGGYAQGRNHRGQRDLAEALVSAVRVGWDNPNPAFRRMFTMRFLPEGKPEEMAWFDELQAQTTSPENAARLYEAWSDVDVTDLAPKVQAETLVAHARGDASVPFEQGRLLAGLIPKARLLPLDSVNHLLLPTDPAARVFMSELHKFTLSAPNAAAAVPIEELSPREREVMQLVTQGLSNEQIAERLFVSVRTVERHLSNVYVKLRVSGKAARAAAAARFSQVA